MTDKLLIIILSLIGMTFSHAIGSTLFLCVTAFTGFYGVISVIGLILIWIVNLFKGKHNGSDNTN